MLRNRSASHSTALFGKARSGERSSIDELLPLIYSELNEIAHSHLQREREDHTFDTSDLVHEAYVNLISKQGLDWKDRAHFFALASQVMRRILIDYARKKKAKKVWRRTSKNEFRWARPSYRRRHRGNPLC